MQFSPIWRTRLVASLTLGLVVVAGCDSPPAREDLGRVLYDVPETPETREPYVLKQLRDPVSASELTENPPEEASATTDDSAVDR